jgi:tyrosine-specific transport protein
MPRKRSIRGNALVVSAAAVLVGTTVNQTEVFALSTRLPQTNTATFRRSALRAYTGPEDSPASESLIDTIADKIGKVDESRIAFPEYESGEVSRMFSSLEYNKSGQSVKAEHSSGSVVGAASLVAGTMVGAGILALPSATAPVGFIPSTGAMGIGWLYMTMSGLLIAELSLNRLGQSGKPGQGMLDLYKETLGPVWSKMGSIAYFFLHYTLMVAYIAQGGVNLDGALSAVGLGGISDVPGIGQLLFAGTCGLGLFAASPALVEKANSLFVLILGVAFLGIVGLGAATADFSALIDPINQHPENVVDAFPIIFLSLVYQNVVPTVVKQLEGDRKKIKQAIVAGTTLPTLMFVLWNAVVIGNVQGADLANIDPLALLQSGVGGGPLLGNLVTTFSSLAIVTSLIGFVYGLLDALTDVMDLPSDGPVYEKWKAPLFGLVFVPPLLFAVGDPDIFYNALDYGGAFGVSTLFLVLPPIMVWGQRYGDASQPLTTKPMVPLGKLSLGSMWKAAGTLIIEQGAEKLGVVDFVQETFFS